MYNFYYILLGERFIETLKVAKVKRRLRGTTTRKIRNDICCSWLLALMKSKVRVSEENPLLNYRFPEIVSQYIREIAPGNVKVRIEKDAYLVSLKTFLLRYKLKDCKCFNTFKNYFFSLSS